MKSLIGACDWLVSLKVGPHLSPQDGGPVGVQDCPVVGGLQAGLRDDQDGPAIVRGLLRRGRECDHELTWREGLHLGCSVVSPEQRS